MIEIVSSNPLIAYQNPASAENWQIFHNLLGSILICSELTQW